jgi:PQQ-dependent catabolism-associated CXXCW motif protein
MTKKAGSLRCVNAVAQGGRGILTAAFFILATAIPAAAEVPIPDDYRMEHYRAPTPGDLPGATVVDSAQAQKLASDGKTWLVFVESTERSSAPPRGWLASPKTVIPGSIWLPNVGKGAPEADEIAYFKRQLDDMRGQKPDAGFLFYCYIDCWVSWNAARRALRSGYGPVYWYPEGIDGWLLEDLPVERIGPTGQP